MAPPAASQQGKSLHRAAAGVRGKHGEARALGPGQLEGIVDRAAMNARGIEALGRETAPRRIDIVDHEIERRLAVALCATRRFRHDEMRAAAQLQHREILVARDWTEPTVSNHSAAAATSRASNMTWPIATGGRRSRVLRGMERSFLAVGRAYTLHQ